MNPCRFAVLALCIGSLLSSAPVAAQPAAPGDENRGRIESIVVSAQKRDERLQDIPMSVTALTPATLAEFNVTDINTLQAAVPNLLFLSVGSVNTVTAYLRGIGTANPVFTQDPAIGIYVDDVYLTRSLGANRNFFDVDRVEVLRGPQGTLYGSNSPAGAIKIVTTKPDLKAGFRAKAEVVVGKYDEHDLNVAMNLPISDGTMAARLAVMYAKHDGYQTNLVDGSDGSTNDSLSARLHFLAKLNEQWNVLLSGDTARVRNIPTNGVSYLTSPIGGDAFTTPGFNKRDFFSEIKDRYDDVDNHGVTADVRGRLLGADFRSISAYRKLEEKLNQDVDGTALNRFTGHQELKNRQFTQELNLGGTQGAVNWLVGAYYIREKNDFLWDVNFLQFLPPPVLIAAGLTPKFQLFDQTKDSWAVFTQETWNVTDLLALTAGVRWTEEKKDFHVVGFNETAPVARGIPPGTPVPGFDIRQEKSWSAPQWRVAADYRVTEDALTFISAARGFRSGGFNGGARSIPEAVAPPFDPEFATTYEVGAKTEWLGHTLRVNATYFYTDYKDQQVSFLNQGGFFGTSTINARMRGVEIESLLKPMQGLTLFANVATLNGHTNSDTILSAPNAKYQFTVGFDFTQPVGNGLSWFASSNYFRTAMYDGSTQHDPLRAIPAHYILGARVGLQSDNGRWKLELIGNNLTNRYYPLFGFNIPPLQTQVRFPNDPRTVNLKLTLNF